MLLRHCNKAKRTKRSRRLAPALIKMTNGLLFFFGPLEQQLIAVRPVAKALIDARDGRGRNADLLRDLREGLTISKKLIRNFRIPDIAGQDDGFAEFVFDGL